MEQRRGPQRESRWGPGCRARAGAQSGLISLNFTGGTPRMNFSSCWPHKATAFQDPSGSSVSSLGGQSVAVLAH